MNQRLETNKTYSFNWLKDNVVDESDSQDQDFELLKESEQSRIQNISDNDENDTKDEEKVVTGILSKFYPSEDDMNHTDLVEDTDSYENNGNFFESQRGAEEIVKSWKANLHQDFIRKSPLSIEINNEESEEEEDKFPFNDDGYDEWQEASELIDDGNVYNNWMKHKVHKKLSPFQDYK